MAERTRAVRAPTRKTTMLQSFTPTQKRRAYPTRTIAVGMAAMIIMLFVSTYLTWQNVNRIRGVTESQIAVLTATEQVEHYGTVLELSIKSVVDHGDVAAAERYRSVQPRLRRTLTDLRKRVRVDDNLASANEVDRADLALIEMEYAALDLVSTGQIATARRIIRSDRYDALVEVYLKGTQRIKQRAEAYVARTRADTNDTLTTIVGLSAAKLLLILMGWFALVRPARRWGNHLDQARRSAEHAALRLHEQQGELQALNRLFFDQARTDPLTGLWTRLKFDEDIALAWPKIERKTASYCAMICDVDFFKQYNDSYGHLAGDEVLRSVAKSLDDNRRAGDRLYRMGGEEFLIVLEDCEGIDAAARAEQYRAAVERLDIVHAESPLGRVTMSVGASCLGPERSATLEAWLGEADAAMYAAKSTGRNAVVCHAHGPA